MTGSATDPDPLLALAQQRVEKLLLALSCPGSGVEHGVFVVFLALFSGSRTADRADNHFFNRPSRPLQHQLGSFVAGPGRSSSPNTRRIHFHRPCLTHSSWRRYAASHLPCSSGISRHDDPVLATQRMPPSTLRWSLGGLAVPPLCAGSRGRTSAQCSLVSLASSGASAVVCRDASP